MRQSVVKYLLENDGPFRLKRFGQLPSRRLSDVCVSQTKWVPNQLLSSSLLYTSTQYLINTRQKVLSYSQLQFIKLLKQLIPIPIQIASTNQTPYTNETIKKKSDSKIGARKI